jgi:hypothetical protein
MNTEEELEKIDFFERTKFNGFSTGLNKPVTDSYKKPRKEGGSKDDKQ